MSYLTLPINPTYGGDFAFKASVPQNQFGDGYSQTAVNGINSVSGSLNLEWSALSLADKQSLCEDFFAVLAGSTPFYYTPYGTSTALLGKCAQWNVTPVAKNVFRVTGTIMQSFDLTLSSPGPEAETVITSTSLTAQTANISVTTMYTTGTSGEGMYRVSGYDVLAQGANVSSNTPDCQISWTDADTGQAQIATLFTGSSSNIWGQTSTGELIIKAAANSSIQYSTVGYASSGSTVMEYNLYLKLEYLGA